MIAAAVTGRVDRAAAEAALVAAVDPHAMASPRAGQRPSAAYAEATR